LQRGAANFVCYHARRSRHAHSVSAAGVDTVLGAGGLRFSTAGRRLNGKLVREKGI